MKLRIAPIVALMFPALPAIACSPPNPLPELSSAEITRHTTKAIQNSDVIVDAIVAHKGETLFLRPIKVWKGKRQSSYELAYACYQPLRIGSKVRVMLTISEVYPKLWSVTMPFLGYGFSTKLFDGLLDAHIGQVRAPDYENGDLVHPPPPTR